MLKSKILSKLDSLLLKATNLYDEYIARALTFKKHSESTVFLISCLAFVKDILGANSEYYLQLHKINSNPLVRPISSMKEIIELLKHIRDYIDEGWASGIRSMISADIFNSFLEMAEYFLREGYKDPAAVIVGSVLENHLKDLCNNNGIPISRLDSKGKSRPIKADTMNQELVKASIYNKLEQKNIVAWLDLRNKAAHGLYLEYDKAHVESMLNGVNNFIIRNPT